MKIEEIRDQEVKKIIEKVRSDILQDRIEYTWDDDYLAECHEEEIDEMEMLKREVEAITEDIFEDYGHCLHDEWLEAKRWMQKTENGKRIPLTDLSNMAENIKDNERKTRYWKDFINEANRLKRLCNKLDKM